jgi:hypothetical protein
MDVKSAFLNDDLKEVYVHQPSGFVILGMEGKVLRLLKALYGLRQAPRVWNETLDCTLKAKGFEQSPHEAPSTGGARVAVSCWWVSTSTT